LLTESENDVTAGACQALPVERDAAGRVYLGELAHIPGLLTVDKPDAL